MYAVIFRAEILKLDKEYVKLTAKLRDLALTRYGCSDFVSVTEGSEEIAISYWENKAQIRAWKQDPEHVHAQELGRSKWYKSYQVQVAEVLRDYGNAP